MLPFLTDAFLEKYLSEILSTLRSPTITVASFFVKPHIEFVGCPLFEQNFFTVRFCLFDRPLGFVVSVRYEEQYLVSLNPALIRILFTFSFFRHCVILFSNILSLLRDFWALEV